MSHDPKVLVQFEVKERGKETFILRGDFDDFEYNRFGANLLSFNIQNKVVFTLSRFASISPDYVSVILGQCALECMYDIAAHMHKGTRLIESLAKFMAVICRVKILTDKECRECVSILDKIFLYRMGFYVHMVRACYALQFLSYESHVEIPQGTIKHVTQLSCNRDNMVAGSALGVLGNIARWGDSDQIEILANDDDVLRCLQMSLSDSRPMMFQWEVCQIITKIADENPTFAQLAKEKFRSRIQNLVVEIKSACEDKLELRTTDWQTGHPLVIEKLNQILEFNALLIALKDHPDTSRFAGDIESVSILVGDMEKGDLKDLYEIYATYALSSGRIEEDKLAALNQLGNIFGLGTNVHLGHLRENI